MKHVPTGVGMVRIGNQEKYYSEVYCIFMLRSSK